MRVVILVGHARLVGFVAAAAALSACAYHPGSFSSPGKVFTGERATVGCLDFAVDRRADYEPPIDHPVDYAAEHRDAAAEHRDAAEQTDAAEQRDEQKPSATSIDEYGKSAVFEYSFGNRCNQPVTLDLATLAVWGQAASGEQFHLYPYDPGMEVRALPIEGRLYGHEVISYPLPQPVTRVCVDVSTISPPHQEPAQWMCFDSKPPASQPAVQPDVVAQGAP